MHATKGAQWIGAQRVKRSLFSDDTQTPLPLLVLGAQVPYSEYAYYLN